PSLGRRGTAKPGSTRQRSLPYPCKRTMPRSPKPSVRHMSHSPAAHAGHGIGSGRRTIPTTRSPGAKPDLAGASSTSPRLSWPMTSLASPDGGVPYAPSAISRSVPQIPTAMPRTSRAPSCMSGPGTSSMPAVPFCPGTTVIARTCASSHPAVAYPSSARGDDGRGGDPDDRVMASSPPRLFDVVVVGAGHDGGVAALRAARLRASTALITSDQFGGMAANDGPVPVRTLAQAARLLREARQLPLYGITGGEPSLDYARLLARVRDVTEDARQHTVLRDDLERAGVDI